MNARMRTIAISWVVVVCALCLIAPSASAAWEDVGGGVRSADPGFPSFDLKRIGGTLYAAVGDGHSIYVSRLEDGYWKYLNRVNTRQARYPSLAEGPNGVPWLAWTEVNGDGVQEVRAGWLDPSGYYWHKPDDRDWAINYRDNSGDYAGGRFAAAEPRLVFLGDRPYITFLNDNGVEWSLRVVRLAESGDAWEVISRGLALSYIPHDPDAAVVDGLLNVGVTNGWDGSAAGRLTQAGQWENRGAPNESITDQYGPVAGDFDAIAGFDGVAHVLWTTEGFNGNPSQPVVSKRTGDTWQVVGGGPVAASGMGESVREIGGRLYVAWIDSATSPELHVSRLADDGASWVEVGGPVGHPVSGGAVLTGLNGVPYIEFSESNGHGSTVRVARLADAPAPIGPDDDGSGPGEDPPVKGTLVLPPRTAPEPPEKPVVDDVCGPRIAGTSRGDRLAGTSAADTIRGLGGDDRLFGRTGYDCLFGGLGEDTLVGGAGNDRLDGGADEDVLAGGAGDDWLRGGAGWDKFHAGPGDDVIDAADGRGESVFCGRGTDRVRADRFDRLRGCEQVRVVR